MKFMCVFALLVCLNNRAFSQTDYWAYLVYFGGCPINHIPKGITIPDRDIQSRSIVDAIIVDSSYDRLRLRFPDSLDFRLSKLTEGKVIKRNDNYFDFLFPVIVGKNRIKLDSIVRAKITDRHLSLDSIVAPLENALAKNPGMLFHFLWSRIIDNSWWNLYNTEFKTEQGPPSIAFIVYPPHPFQCGTNFDFTPDTGQIAVTWSYNIFDQSDSLPSTPAFYNLALKKPISERDRAFFLKHSLLDSNSTVNLFTYREGSALDILCDTLKGRFINLVDGVFDYRELSKVFNIPSDELFIVISHEMAYELFHRLDDEKRSILMPIMRKDNPLTDLSYLISIRLPNH